MGSAALSLSVAPAASGGGGGGSASNAAWQATSAQGFHFTLGCNMSSAAHGFAPSQAQRRGHRPATTL